eukprot:TRINITY_DN4255_c0_g1::TRINITY_DN4255_c0_g1_i1::g.7917::m.7917 TRINITY_DN4255_c0_g1::TRINITY_DN4255_c0_g1_i1::g.7917  ORF type:complete len:678 (+),score=197.77,sp/Q9C5Z1/EIF3B_ARATH/41.52/1e-175,eIF2A/PF08662.6/0.12,eIF2A/PF08662.6/2.2e+02,eIF2A/PF08662.6/8.6e-48,RRM_1/PF00076.17/9e-07,RRM_6/PF14259.1/2e-05,WD40/PF00400.27/1.2e+03,WD40/PF00400.27/1.7,WD40/PF00400.27/41,WD40/PF00400.27/1.8e+03,WD40/PF00400.27/3e+03,WD40/PF00400.27/3.3e+03,IKI3/PF04762.7/0.00098,Lactonase/PF10282.4/0.13,Lactonase/
MVEKDSVAGGDDDFQVDPSEFKKDLWKTIILVDNLPVVPTEKFDKLLSVVTKIYSQLGEVVELVMPKGADGMSKGFAFVQFKTVEMAKLAQARTESYQLDKSHIFKVNGFEDVEKYMAADEKAPEPQVEPFQERGNLRDWCLDPRARDHFAIRAGDETEIFWNEVHSTPQSAFSRGQWSEGYPLWSPQGSYFATFHRMGCAIWGTLQFSKFARFEHPGVKAVDFSPCERYLVTWSQDGYEGTENVIIWDVRSGRKLRGFSAPDPDVAWPFFKFNHDGSYVARRGKDAINVYSLPDLQLVDKKKVQVENVRDISWSPRDNYLAYWTPEAGNSPARVVILDIPSRKEVAQKNIFSVADISLHWQSVGDYLAVKADRLTKSKKGKFTDLHIFRMREKGLPVEVIEINSAIQSFAWEPKGHRFAVIHGEGAKPDVSFYTMIRSKDNKIKLLAKLDKKSASNICWSPQGENVILAGLKAMEGSLEFYFISKEDEVQHVVSTDHYMANEVQWDPSGRFVTTTVPFSRYQHECGYNIWTMHGKLLHKIAKDRFVSFSWRPRPISLLTPEAIKNIRKNLREYSKKFDAEDERLRRRLEAGESEHRRMILEEWTKFILAKEEEYIQEQDMRFRARNGRSDDDDECVEVIMEEEEILSEHEDLVFDD